MNKENNDDLYTRNDVDPRWDPSFEKIRKEEVEDFFNYFFENSECDTQAEKDSSEKEIDSYIEKMQSSDSTPYICNYIFENLYKIWSPEFGLNPPYSSNDSEELRSKAPDLYRSIDILCSVIYKIKQSNKETHTKTDQIDNRLDTVDNNLSDQKNNLESEINNQKDNILSDIKSLIYPEIITILGIFTAITFAIFGGMNLLSNLFQNMKSTHTSLGQALILAAIFGLIMWGITILLFYWISTIKKDQSKKFYKNWGFWVNILFIVLILLVLIIGLCFFFK